MNSPVQQETEFVWRRILEALPPGALFLPVAFAFAVLLVVFLFDVSGSMVAVVDDLPRPGEDPALLPTRQDKVIRFLSDAAGRGKAGQPTFLDRVLARSPVSAYRFGAVADDVDVQQFHAGRKWTTREEWAAWLKPDKTKIVVARDLPAPEQAKVRARLNDLYDDLLTGTK